MTVHTRHSPSQQLPLHPSGPLPAAPVRARRQAWPVRPDLPAAVLALIGLGANAALYYAIGSRHELGYDPLAPEELQRLVPGLHRHEAYVCGPPGMTQAAVTSLRTAGVPGRRIHRESFDF